MHFEEALRIVKVMKNPSAQHISLAVLFRPESEGGFTATVPSLPGCITYGKDLPEAHHMIEEAISLYIEDMIADGESLPATDAPSYFTQLDINIPINIPAQRTLFHA